MGSTLDEEAPPREDWLGERSGSMTTLEHSNWTKLAMTGWREVKEDEARGPGWGKMRLPDN